MPRPHRGGTPTYVPVPPGVLQQAHDALSANVDQLDNEYLKAQVEAMIVEAEEYLEQGGQPCVWRRWVWRVSATLWDVAELTGDEDAKKAGDKLYEFWDGNPCEPA